MPSYFNKFPKVFYGYGKDSAEAATNLTVKFKFQDEFVDNSVAFYEYTVADGETPEMIAGKIYDDTEKHWAILLINNIVNPQNDWLMDQKTLISYIDKKYEPFANTQINETGYEWATENIHSYYKVITKTNRTYNLKTVTKIQIDQNAHSNLASSISEYVLPSGETISTRIEKQQKTYYEYEIEENEKKRSIKIPKKEVVSQLDEELKRIFL